MPRDELDRRFRSGAGRICLDFIRTLRFRGRPDAVEELDTSERVDAWFRQFGLYEDATDEPDRAARARSLREQLCDLIEAATGPGGVRRCPPESRAGINAAAQVPVPAPWLDGNGSLTHHADHPAAAALALLARDGLELVGSPDLARVRRCANPDCRVWFVDGSRSGLRRWCSMSTCGNRAKKAAQRAHGDRTHSA